MTNKRNLEISTQVLFPDETLDSIGKKYGISRERVRQIFAKSSGNRKYGNIKKQLFAASKKYVCVICGKPLSLLQKQGKYQSKKFCSKACYRIACDFSNQVKICKNCKKEFFPHRNNPYQVKVVFCCLICFFYYRKKHGWWSKKTKKL